MNANGRDEYAPLAARVAELERALALLVRRIEEQLITRLLDHDRDLDTLAAELAGQGEQLRQLARELEHYRAAVSAAQREADHG